MLTGEGQLHLSPSLPPVALLPLSPSCTSRSLVTHLPHWDAAFNHYPLKVLSALTDPRMTSSSHIHFLSAHACGHDE